ncbi:hypothetical protein Taro_017399 [Colocasia esculenta]|uniref:Uncharacterized protein n=1 Tax=Colocasia esculenta TaxID=4460 RepID=A0A843UT17_COLES|nr:hypothetical protein [Colocasia esculenta]
MTEEVVALVPEQGAVLEDVPAPSEKGKRQATKVHSLKPTTLQVPLRASSRAAGRLALLKIRRGVRVSSSETPVTISSESSSSTDGARHISTSGKTRASSDVSSTEKISALKGIGDDSTSSAAASPIIETEITATRDILSKRDPSPMVLSSGVLPSAEVDPSLSWAIVVYNPLRIAVQEGASEVALEAGEGALMQVSDSSNIPPQSQVLRIEAATMAEESASTTVVPEAQVVYPVEGSSSIIALPSCPGIVDASIWAEVDRQVSFQVPPVTMSGSSFPFELIIKQQLSSLRLIIDRDPRPRYEKIKPIIEKMTELLACMGCPLDDWVRRVTLVLKFLKRAQFMRDEMPTYAMMLQTQRSECERALKPLCATEDHNLALIEANAESSAVLQDKILALKAALTDAEAELQRLKDLRAQYEEANSKLKVQTTEIKAVLKKVKIQEERLREMASSPSVGITSLEEIFRDL